MARIGTLLIAIQRASWRDVSSLLSIPANNLLLFAAFLFSQQPRSASFFLLIVVSAGILLFSDDPLRRIEPRFTLWPFNSNQVLTLRLLVFLLTPTFLLAAGTSLAVQQAGIAVALVGGAMVLQIVRFLLPLIPTPRSVTSFQFLPVSLAPATVALALSTHSQALFGYDGVAGMARFRLWPLPGWRILVAKDLGVLTLVTGLSLPLDVYVGLAATLASLSIGNYASIRPEAPFQRRWRFASGHLIMAGLLQTITVFAVGTWTFDAGPSVLALAGISWLVSVWCCGRLWDRTAVST